VTNAREMKKNSKERRMITYLRESMISIHHGTEACQDKLPPGIEVCKNELEGLGVPALHPQVKVFSATSSDMTPRPSFATSMPRYVWMCTSIIGASSWY
jgi:hypothetical protein